MTATVLLVRHPPVALAWSGRCYGRSDMGWSRDGARRASVLVDELAALHPNAIVHSGVIRTRRLAERVARRLGVAAVADPRWRERDLGSWEGRRWDAIWRETGDLMDRMTTDPEGFRPGGGETTRELADRVAAAWADLPIPGLTAVITHGGPIATLRAAATGNDLSTCAAMVPGCGERVCLDRDLAPWGSPSGPAP